MIGRAISHYLIQELLGKGGMGVVYRAMDQRLSRNVAIKLLRPDAFADAGRHKRFVQEARAASALNHPNIVTIFEIDTTQDGTGFIVMEYISGKTLDAHIGRKGMRLTDVLKYAVQVADGLAAAHEAGIIHRDLKPGNIMISDKGMAKLLDFGLAKLSEPVDTVAEAAATQTLGSAPPRTEEGVVMGTVAYMSPEQAQGLPVDARSDIFSFGALLYEMITGRRAFQGANRMSTVTSLMRDEPPAIKDVAEIVPPELERAIRRCLRKDREKRVQHMSDLKLLLEELKEDTESGRLVATAAVSKPRRSRWLLAGVASTCLLIGVGITWFVLRKSTSPPSAVIDLTNDAGFNGEPALSPDGKLLAFASDREGTGQINIWVKQVPAGEPVKITNERSALDPQFSVDGTRIYYHTPLDVAINVVPALGGISRRLVSPAIRGRVSPDGSRLAYLLHDSVATTDVICLVNSAGGPSQKLSTPLRRAESVIWSPDGTRLLAYGTLSQYFADNVQLEWWLVDPSSGKMEPTGIVPRLREFGFTKAFGAFPYVWHQNSVLFGGTKESKTAIWRQPVDFRAHFTGAPVRLTNGTQEETTATWSASGLVAFAGLNSAYVNLWAAPLDADHARVTGELQRITRTGAVNGNPSVTPDGRFAAFRSNRTGNTDLWFKDLRTGKEIQLTNDPGHEDRPALSPDGSRVAYSYPEGKNWLLPVEGGSPELLCENCGEARGWFPDNRRILLNLAPRTAHSAVGSYDVATRKILTLIEHPKFAVGRARVSPDGKWIAFELAPSTSTRQVFIAPLGDAPGKESEWIAVTDGKTWDNKPEWSPNGRYVYYFSNRDGFGCVWAHAFDPQKRRVIGEAIGVLHMHTSEKTMLSLSAVDFDICVAKDKLVLNAGEVTANIHAMKIQ